MNKMSYWSRSSYMCNKNTVYVLLNKKLNLYKFGITEKDVNLKVNDYCISNYCDVTDIEVIFSYTYKNGMSIEDLLNKCINGKRIKLPNSNYYYKEHFRKEQLENILSILESQK